MQYSHELIMPNKDLPFKMFLFEGKDGNYFRDKHWHRSIEIFAVLDGGLVFHIGDRTYPLSRGEFILVNSNEIHSVDSPKPNRTVVLQIPLKTFEEYFTGDQFILFSHDPKIQDEQVMALIREMYDAYTGKDCGYEMKVKSQYYMLLYLLVTKYRELDVSRDAVKRSKKLTKLSAITNYIKEKYTEDLSLETPFPNVPEIRRNQLQVLFTGNPSGICLPGTARNQPHDQRYRFEQRLSEQ